MEVVTNEPTPVVSVDPVDFGDPLANLGEAIIVCAKFQNKVQRMHEKFLKTLPKRITCPKCQKSRKREMFGVRIPRNKETGEPEKPRRQSYCQDCRNGKVVMSVPAKSKVEEVAVEVGTAPAPAVEIGAEQAA